MIKKLLLAFILLILAGCPQEKFEWNPIFEETHFDYINTEVERSLALINNALIQVEVNNQPPVRHDLSKARNRLLEIKNYYIPLTTVRQKIYDAERYFKLKNIKKTNELLKNSQSIVASLDSLTKNTVFDKVILELNAMINEVIASLDDDSTFNTYNKMKTLGEHVNLMLYRGDLILSGIEFNK